MPGHRAFRRRAQPHPGRHRRRHRPGGGQGRAAGRLSSEGVLPPFGEPTGPALDDAALLAAFARHDREGHAPAFHLEGGGDLLVTAGDSAAALWIGPRTLLVRADLPDHLAERKGAVEAALAGAGFECHDSDTLFATPIAIQTLGLRVSSWDLWGADIEEAFVDLRAAAAGGGDSSPTDGLLGPGPGI